MRHSVQAVLVSMCVLLAVGCRTATKISEMPRVDIAFEGGNRGYLIGTPPPPKEIKPTRQMVETVVEVPSFYKLKRTGAVGNIESITAPQTDVSEEEASSEMKAPAVFDVYVVKKGESLWSIAAKPEIYGKATRWRRIFEANRELLKSPNRLREGMRLKIPRDAAGGEGPSYGEQGGAYKK